MVGESSGHEREVAGVVEHAELVEESYASGSGTVAFTNRKLRAAVQTVVTLDQTRAVELVDPSVQVQ